MERDQLLSDELEDYARAHTQPASELLERLEVDTLEQTESPRMLSGRVQGQFLKMLVALSSARRVLEIGMFTGYSALAMAEALPADGELHTCDIDPSAKEFASRYFAESPHGDKIQVHLGPALETIDQLAGSFDLAFIDADKPNYPRYYDAVLPRVRAGGLLVFDNVLWKGTVVAPNDESGKQIHALNERVQKDDRVENVLVAMRDGLMLARKL